ncbi:MAG: GNAT family N-acetyltransferase [Burkholderiaceae bacterium]|nr:GNAT family N-acetyltransferase [Burkholderiaceae bacterium]
MNTLTADGLILEPQTAAHADEMFLILSDPALYEFENEPPASAAWLRERFSKLESRRSADGEEAWLNWVIRRSGRELIGYVQATVRKDRSAVIAYVLGSRHWGQGYAHRAVRAMMNELADQYGVRDFLAIFKRANMRSRRLLERLGFVEVGVDRGLQVHIQPDEVLMRFCISAA